MHRGRRRSDEIRRIEFLERDDTFQKAHDYKRRIFRNSVRVPMITRTFTFSKRKKRTHARHDVGFCLTGVVRRTTTRLRRTIKKIYVKIIRADDAATVTIVGGGEETEKNFATLRVYMDTRVDATGTKL